MAGMERIGGLGDTALRRRVPMRETLRRMDLLGLLRNALKRWGSIRYLPVI